MMASLKNHPFPVEAYFERSLVLTFALNKEDLRNFIPPKLALDTFHDEWAFLAVAMVQTHHLRPKGFPKILGHDFFLIGYRVFVRYQNLAGKNIRGLYILKSETDKKKMQCLGNIFTHYNYTTTDIKITGNNSFETIQSNRSDFEVTVSKEKKEFALPDLSPFESWKVARRFAGPLPFTFSWLPKNDSMLIVEGVRGHWQPSPVQVVRYHFDFLNRTEFKTAKLASAFEVSNIPYHWKKGKQEAWR